MGQVLQINPTLIFRGGSKGGGLGIHAHLKTLYMCNLPNIPLEVVDGLWSHITAVPLYGFSGSATDYSPELFLVWEQSSSIVLCQYNC